MNIKRLNEELQKVLNEQDNSINLAKFHFKNYLNPDGQNYKGRETYSSTLKSVLEEIERLYKKVKTNYAGGTTAYEQFKTHCENLWKHSTVRDALSLRSSTVKKQPGLESAIKALHNYQDQLANDLINLTKWDGNEWIKKLNEELKKHLREGNESIVDFIENKLKFIPNIQTDEEMDEYLDDILAQVLQEFEDTALDKTLTIKYPEHGEVRYYPPAKVIYEDGTYYID